MTPHDYASDRIKCLQVMQSYHDQIAKEQERLKALLMNNGTLRRNYRLLGTEREVNRSLAARRDAKLYKEKYQKLLKDTQLARKGKTVDKKAIDRLNKRLGWYAVTEESILEPEKYWFLFNEDVLWLKTGGRSPYEVHTLDQTEQTQTESSTGMPVNA
jgi:hypothetical protein